MPLEVATVLLIPIYKSGRWGKSIALRELRLEAEALAQKAVSLDDGNALTHAQLCRVYLMKKQHEKAITEGKRAIELGPNLFQAYFNLGYALNFAGKPDKAIPVLETAIRLNPLPDAFLYLQLGIAYRDLGQYDKAITASKKGLRISPDNLWLHLSLAITYSLTGREKEARAEAAEALRINPMFSVGFWSKVVPYKNKADRDRVANAMRKAGLK